MKMERCPFCGSEAYTWGGPEHGYAECKNEGGECGALMQIGAESEDEAVDIWNDRIRRTKNEEGVASCPWCGKHPSIDEMDADIWENKRMMIEADESTKRVLYYLGCRTKPGNKPGECPVTPEFWADTKEKAIALWNGEKEAWDEVSKRK